MAHVWIFLLALCWWGYSISFPGQREELADDQELLTINIDMSANIKEAKNVKKSEASAPVEEAVSVSALEAKIAELESALAKAKADQVVVVARGMSFRAPELSALLHRARSLNGEAETGSEVEGRISKSKELGRFRAARHLLRDAETEKERAAESVHNAAIALMGAAGRAGKAGL